jgi:hypothetical protein
MMPKRLRHYLRISVTSSKVIQQSGAFPEHGRRLYYVSQGLIEYSENSFS